MKLDENPCQNMKLNEIACKTLEIDGNQWKIMKTKTAVMATATTTPTTMTTSTHKQIWFLLPRGVFTVYGYLLYMDRCNVYIHTHICI